MLLIVAVVVLLLAPDPWNLILGFVFLLLGIGELLFWNHTVRGRRKVVGAQTLVGRTAEVRVACRPHTPLPRAPQRGRPGRSACTPPELRRSAR